MVSFSGIFGEEVRYFLVALLGAILIFLLSRCAVERQVILWHADEYKTYREMMIYAFKDSTAYAKFAMIRWGDSTEVARWDSIINEWLVK